MTFTDQPTELSGTLQDQSGRPAPDYFIIVFPSDPALRFAQSRRIHALRPATDGRFVVRGLPAGEYFIAALTDVEPGEWLDPDFLNRSIPTAIKVALSESQKLEQNIRLR